MAALPVFGVAAFLGLLGYALIQNRYIEAHDAIPGTEWQMFEVPAAVQLQLPGLAMPASNLLAKLSVGGQEPSIRAWWVERNGGYFYVGIQEYPTGAKVTPELLDRILAEIKAENSKRYVYHDESITLQGKAGREFKFTRPYTTLRAYIDEQRLYVMATDWYVDSDVRRFFDSLRVIEQN